MNPRDEIERLPLIVPNCQQASRLQSRDLEHPLPLRQRLALRVHLFFCKWCRRYGKQIKSLHATLRNSENSAATMPQSLPADAKERLKEALQKRISDS
jgi:hypothetical protein